MDTDAQKKVREDGGLSGERMAAAWLEKNGFEILHKHEKKSADPWDIEAQTYGALWLIEVKSEIGAKGRPGVKIQNLQKMINEGSELVLSAKQNYEADMLLKVGLIFVPKDGDPLLFVLDEKCYKGMTSNGVSSTADSSKS